MFIKAPSAGDRHRGPNNIQAHGKSCASSKLAGTRLWKVVGENLGILLCRIINFHTQPMLDIRPPGAQKGEKRDRRV